jgi:hypothetical protein
MEALSSFAEALRHVLPLLEEESKTVEDANSSPINAHWLLDLCGKVPSELGANRLARAVWEASKLSDEGRQQEALFEALGASEEAMVLLFEVAPLLPQIRQYIKSSDLGDDSSSEYDAALAAAMSGGSTTQVDEMELNRQRLRQEALDTAQIAAIARAEADAIRGGSSLLGGSMATHSITRASDVKAQKLADKASKRAAQALQRAKAAGAILDESEFLAVDSSAHAMGQGGLMGQSTDEIRALQQSLLPEGSRQLHNSDGLPSGTEREYNDKIGYEKVTIPPPRLDRASLHPRLKIADILDPECGRAFEGTGSLNPMQSAVFDTAFNRRENLLVCAPTGAGQSNLLWVKQITPPPFPHLVLCSSHVHLSGSLYRKDQCCHADSDGTFS